MKFKHRRVLIASLAVLVLALLLPSSAFAASVTPDYNTTINEYTMEMTVNENHSYDIKITENVTFKNRQHGIYRYIPIYGTYYREIDGQQDERSYSATFSNFKMLSGQDYDLSTEDGSEVIKIGSSSSYVTGNQTYSYSFTWDPGDDGITSFDDVYFNVFNGYLENPIEHLSLTVNMPKSFNSDDVHFYSGDSYGATDAGDFTWTISGNTITGESTAAMDPGSVLTMNIRLPEGYFVGARTGTEMYTVSYVIAGICAVAGIALWLILGRGNKPLEPVTFYPPDGLSSAQVGYILKPEGKHDNDIVSLIVYFADKGYLTIRALDESGKKVELHKAAEISPKAPAYERTLYRALFRNSDDVKLDSLSGSSRFYESFHSSVEQLGDWFNTPKHSLIAASATTAKAIIILLICLTSVGYGIAASYNVNGYFDLFGVAFYAATAGLLALAAAGSHSKKAFIGFLVLDAVVMFFFAILSLTGEMPFFVCFAAIVVLAMLATQCTRRTEQGSKWLGECRAFRHFIKTAELDKLKMLVEEDPMYFYNVLPYAYVMGLTDKWIKNFESIKLEPPVWNYDPY